MNKTPELKGIRKIIDLFAVQVANDASLCGEKYHTRLDSVVRGLSPLLATKEHDEALLREFVEYIKYNFSDQDGYEFSTVERNEIDDMLGKFIASRKVSSSGEGK